MKSRLIAAVLALTMPTAGCATMPEAEHNVLPATVVVAFDIERVTPLIVEGVADRETGRLVKANDPVRIASISKMIMALATLRLVDEGTVDLNADISDYLGWQVRSPNFPDVKVTLAQLLSHRSGLRDGAGYVIPLGESLEAKLADPEAWYPDAPPGEAPFEYANLGSPVVATVLEAATGERYDRLLERTVFAPLGIKACVNWIGCDADMVARAVTLYRGTGEVARDDAADLPPNCTIPVAEGVECSLDDYVPGTNASIFSPQGGVRIGMMDLAKIGQALLDEPRFVETKALDRSQLRQLWRRHEGQEFFCHYALGFHVIGLAVENCRDRLFEEGPPRIGHAGEAYGLRSGLWFNDTTGIGIAYFTTAVPSRQSAEDEGGFDPREIASMKRAQALLAQQSGD
ncbi:serine hydrolase [Erythrobacter sp. THAF29]|uniref:serine hydrolase domain-containing protein n=1 Tax=Erythrobacter sp. THAF29 TaxID=2587851 RepID=UPI0012A90BCE|nr:serine hydrolase domain-containing protein [Erythrobacter sp. THAF29]QFT78845.1 D-alanyl-D-alanine carboxypeptidase precursor [Erythrobacter sp. THAF29]